MASKIDVTVAVIGSLNTDLVVRAPRQPAPGETLTVHSLTIGCGGKGANQAVAVRRMTAPKSTNQESKKDESTTSNERSVIEIHTRMRGAVGADSFGDKLLDKLGREDGVDTSYVQVFKGVETGSAVVTVDDQGQNSIMVIPGANGLFGLTGDKVVLKGDEDVVVCQLEVDISVVMANLRTARQIQALPIATAELANVDFLIMNETETAILAGLPASSLDKETDNARFFSILQPFLDAGVQHVIITRGEHGTLYASKADPNVRSVLPAVKVEREKVVDTTCAGDTFLGAFVAAIASTVGRSYWRSLRAGVSRRQLFAAEVNVSSVVEKAIDLAQHAAARAIQTEGAIGSIPYAHDFDGQFPTLLPFDEIKEDMN